MRINWKIRFKNKTFIVSFVTVVLSFVYQMLGFFDVVPKVSQSDLINYVSMIVNLLVALGVLVDPTTKGIQDSDRAMTYK